MHTADDLTVRDFMAPDFEIESEDPSAQFSALQMFATSLALCTYSVLYGYGAQLHVASDGIAIRVRWRYVEQPFRIGAIDMKIHWPDLPKSRLKAAERAAAMCTIHNTLHQPPAVVTRVVAEDHDI